MIIAFLVSFMILISGFFYIKIPASNFKYNFISPLILLPVFVLLYMIIGFEAYWKGRYVFLGADFSPALDRLYNVTSVFEICFFVFFVFFYYYFKGNKNNSYALNYNPDKNYFLSFTCFMGMYSILSHLGFSFPIVHNFLMLFFNAAIILVSYAYISKMKGRFFLLITFSFLSVYMGFRYRLIFLFLPIIMYIFVFYRLTVYRSIKYIAIVFFSISIVALVGITRQYGKGLQFEKLEGISFFDMLVKGIFNDTSTVLTSGAFIKWVDEAENYAYFKQIWYVLNYFIPNSIYPDKEYSPIFKYLSILTGQVNNESGTAVLGFAEYYHTAGYYGVIFFAFIFALVLSKFFKRMLISKSKYDHFQYFILLTWFINSLTRGYFPQNAQDLISIIIGLYMIKRFSKPVYLGSTFEINNK